MAISQKPLSFEEMMSSAGSSAPGTDPTSGVATPDVDSVVVDPKIMKQLDKIDPTQVFQYLKDKKLIPADMKPLSGEGSDTEEASETPGEESSEDAAPAAPAAPISYSDMSK